MSRVLGFVLLLASIGFALYRLIILSPGDWIRLGYYKVIPGMLIVGMVFTALGLIRSRSKQVSLLLIIFFVAFVSSLVSIRQLTSGDYYLWVTRFTDIVTLGVVIGAGIIYKNKL